ncbi:MAG: hypothetical protein AAGB22_14500, partial [Bacteroidota bacterium]
NSDRIFVGGVSGGLFVSEDGSGTWTQLEDFANNGFSSAIIASMAQAPNGDIYVGTGSNFDGVANVLSILFPGKGIFVSRDGGNSFQSLPSTFPTNLNTTSEVWNTVNRIAINQTTGRIYAATNRGLQMSDDDGATWINPVYLDPNQTVPATGVCHDVVVADNGAVLTVIGGSTFRSDNGNDQSFTNVTANGLGVATRVVLSIAPSNNDIVYALTSAAGAFGGLYRSQDNGRSWSQQLRLESFESGDPMGGQGVYNLALGVSPNNPDKVLIGGVQLWRWDGNLTRIALEGVNPLDPRYVHADKHVFTWDPNNPNIVYIGSDGGVTKSVNDAASFLTVNKGLITTQFYGISQADFGGQEVVIGGTQDNGTWLLTGDNPNDPLFGQ